MWGAPTAGDAGLLASCYRSILDVAIANGLHSVVFCSISTGVFGYPKADAALAAVDTVDRWLADNPGTGLRIVISTFADVEEQAYARTLTERISQ